MGPKFAPAQSLGRPISFQRGPIKRANLIGASNIGPTSNRLSAVPTLSIYAQKVPTLAMFDKKNMILSTDFDQNFREEWVPDTGVVHAFKSFHNNKET